MKGGEGGSHSGRRRGRGRGGTPWEEVGGEVEGGGEGEGGRYK